MPDYKKFKAIKDQLGSLSKLVADYETDFGGTSGYESESSYAKQMDDDFEYKMPKKASGEEDGGFGDKEAFDGGSNPPTDLSPEMDSTAEESGVAKEPKKKKMAMISSMLKAKMSKGKSSY